MRELSHVCNATSMNAFVMYLKAVNFLCRGTGHYNYNCNIGLCCGSSDIDRPASYLHCFEEIQ